MIIATFTHWAKEEVEKKNKQTKHNDGVRMEQNDIEIADSMRIKTATAMAHNQQLQAK